MKRYFYRDALAAAWMAKHFGMGFHTGGGDFCKMEMHATAQGYVEDHFGLNAYRWYIHPGSLHLLDPQPGDKIALLPGGGGKEIWADVSRFVRKDDELYPSMGNGSPIIMFDGMAYQYASRMTKIIQRNGKVFHTPESEEA